jgi:hypothetical protein
MAPGWVALLGNERAGRLPRQQLGVTRRPGREALNTLAGFGFVDLVPVFEASVHAAPRWGHAAKPVARPSGTRRCITDRDRSRSPAGISR